MIAQVCRYVHRIRGRWRNFSPFFRWMQMQDADTLAARSPAVSRAAKTCGPARYSLSSALFGFSCLPRSSVSMNHEKIVVVSLFLISLRVRAAVNFWRSVDDEWCSIRVTTDARSVSQWSLMKRVYWQCLLSKSLRPGSKMHAAVEKNAHLFT